MIHRGPLGVSLLCNKQLNSAVSVHYTQTQFDIGMKGVARRRKVDDIGDNLGEKKAGPDRLIFAKAKAIVTDKREDAQNS